jgi:hypothetical protein
MKRNRVTARAEHDEQAGFACGRRSDDFASGVFPGKVISKQDIFRQDRQ